MSRFMFAAVAMPVPEPVYDGDLGIALDAYAAARASSRRLAFREQAEPDKRRFVAERLNCNHRLRLAAKSVVDALNRLDAAAMPIRRHYRKSAIEIQRRFTRGNVVAGN